MQKLLVGKKKTLRRLSALLKGLPAECWEELMETYKQKIVLYSYSECLCEQMAPERRCES